MTPKEERPRGLGRGLSALIGDEAAPTRGEVPAKGSRTLPVAFLQARQISAAQDFRRRGAGRSRRLDQGEGRAHAHPGAAAGHRQL